MGYLTLELTLISAKDLKNVNLIGVMDVYVVVSLSHDPRSKQKTPVHTDGGTKPSWNHTMKFTIDEHSASNSVLICEIKHESFGRDKEIGEVKIPVAELISTSRNQKSAKQFAAYQVKRASGKSHGELNISYSVIDAPDSAVKGDNPAGYGYGAPAAGYPPAASCVGSSGYGGQPPYPAPGHGAAAAYPPPAGYAGAPPPPPPAGYGGAPPPPAGYAQPYAPPAGYPGQGSGAPYQQQGYGYPPAQRYPPAPYGGGYPPQQGGYGYPQGQPGGYPGQQYNGQQKPKKGGMGGMGMGLGLGLVGGAVGGLIVGDMISDAVDDGGDFDF